MNKTIPISKKARKKLRLARYPTLLRLDQRVRSVMGPARPVILHASGPRDQRVRSVLRKRRRCAIGASGQFDQRVRSI
jgi:hypothetical protein